MSHVLLIRALEDAIPLASYLEALGKKALCYPLFEPIFFAIPPLENPQALIITSKNALRALNNSNHLKKVPLYVVGDQTAALAHQLGFTTVFNASGNSKDLQNLIVQQALPEEGVLYYLSGRIIKRDIVRELRALGFKAQRQVVYQTNYIERFSNSLITDFFNKKISHVLFFSPRTTELFVDLVKTSKLEKEIALNKALCLSYDIAEKAQEILWKEIWISPHPSTHNMLGYFDDGK
ncbi:MAG: uroporphyrinogen-III synthase [Alphaproteobacteria bacterium]|nr:uroporphyrinogen-III synthase [Alphaproteobacteria bacterium]